MPKGKYIRIDAIAMMLAGAAAMCILLIGSPDDYLWPFLYSLMIFIAGVYGLVVIGRK